MLQTIFVEFDLFHQIDDTSGYVHMVGDWSDAKKILFFTGATKASAATIAKDRNLNRRTRTTWHV